MIMGPPMRKIEFSSSRFFKMFMSGQMRRISAAHAPFVDVRDVALAHLLAIKNPAAANRRFILVKECPSFQEYAAPVIAKFRPLGWPITETMAEPNAEEYVSLFNNSASVELGVVYTDFTKTMVDMADKMVELGTIVKPA